MTFDVDVKPFDGSKEKKKLKVKNSVLKSAKLFAFTVEASVPGDYFISVSTVLKMWKVQRLQRKYFKKDSSTEVESVL